MATTAKPCIVLVDMDGTIANYDEGMALELRKKFDNPHYTAQNWHTHGFKPNMIHSRPGFFRELKPIRGALEALREMKAEGHTVFIVSSPSISGNCHSDKCEWVKEHLGEEWARRLILTKDKTLVIGDVLIDDRKQHGVMEVPTWRQVFFARPEVPCVIETTVYLTDWTHWRTALCKALTQNFL